MSSHLTRAVFRQLVSETLLRHPGCRASHRSFPGVGTRAPCVARRSQLHQRRSFFGMSIFSGGRPPVTEPRLDPGIDKLMEHAKRVRLRARLNNPEEVKRALERFFRAKDDTGVPIEDQQLVLVQKGYDYIRGIEGAGLDRSTLKTALKCLTRIHWNGQPLDLPRKEEVTEKGYLIWQMYNDLLVQTHAADEVLEVEDLETCLQAFATSGDVVKACDLALSSVVTVTPAALRGSEPESQTPIDVKLPEADKVRLLLLAMSGFNLVTAQEQLHKTLESAAAQGIKIEEESDIVVFLCTLYARQGSRLDEAKKWYSPKLILPVFTNESTAETTRANITDMYTVLMKACIQENDIKWGNEIAAGLVKHSESHDHRRLIDLVLIWAVGSGKGADEIERMMAVLGKRLKYVPDIGSFNGIMSMLLWKKQHYQAERVFNLMASMKVKPDTQTFLIQLEYRLSLDDVDGAVATYKRMQKETLPQEGEASSLMNKLICAMCDTRRHSFDRIMDVAADLTDQHSRFEALTVSKLAILHLTRNETEDAEDLLNTHSFQFSIAERQGVLEALLKFCSNEETETEQVWATYLLMKKTFDDMNREQRSRFMQEMIRRKEGHYAVQIFEHMRLHTREDTLPTRKTYIDAIIGLGILSDRREFAQLYNMLKLDTSIEPSTALHNALMQTCIACGMAERALTFWDAIAVSDEGPDLFSIKMAMRACVDAPEGASKAIQIHRRLEASGFEMKPVYFGWFLGAMGGQGLYNESLALMLRLEKEKGIAPTKEMIGGLLNGSRSKEAQARILEWAKEKAPNVYPQLLKAHEHTDYAGKKIFNVDKKIGFNPGE